MKLRPSILNPLFTDVKSLKGVGPKISELLSKLVGNKIINLILHFPHGYIDRRFNPKIQDAIHNTICTVEIEIIKHTVPNSYSRAPYKVFCKDETGEIILIFFNADKLYLKDTLPIGEKRIVSGKVELYNGKKQITHPDHIVLSSQINNILRIEPSYPLTASLSPKTLGKIIDESLEKIIELPEWISSDMIKKNNWESWHKSIKSVHKSKIIENINQTSNSKTRLAYDELLSNQLALGIVRSKSRKLPGRKLKTNGHLQNKLFTITNFDLTNAQKRTIKEINDDLSSNQRMLRLLQGDVGSGKTIVAISTMLAAIDNSGQATMMAPTEILARQHYETLRPICDTCGITLVYLSGKITGTQRAIILDKIKNGSASIIIGTHALFQKEVIFDNLLIAVIDEQHRFGVHQRLELTNKGKGLDVLVMTATPIPRTLTLTTYGDMDVSRLDEKPLGRLSIDTRIINIKRIPEVIDAVKRAVKKNSKIYWICPLIEESEIMDLAAAEERYENLKSIFGNKVSLVHSKIKPEDRESIIEDFAAPNNENPVQILVSTTVIEVGIDVPDATIIIIEHAERFGLTQLHQLRGRVGRSDKSSNCILLYKSPLSDFAEKRLNILKENNDGFSIAEEDLKMRGQGEILGSKQSGLPQFKIADLTIHNDLLLAARNDTKIILESDPHLKDNRGQALRTLLYLFEQDDAIQTLRSG